jgi:Spy/CpxP family protein refolding chaperone
MPETNETNAGKPVRSRRWPWVGGTALALLGLLVALAPRASAYRALRAHGFASRPHGFALRMGHDPAAMKQHAAMALEWALRGVDATAEQKAQAKRIAERVVDELAPLLEKHRANTHAIALELAKPEIDKAAIDRLRQQQVALADQASKTVVGGVTELAQSLTPEQRQELLDFAQRLHGEPAL